MYVVHQMIFKVVVTYRDTGYDTGYTKEPVWFRWTSFVNLTKDSKWTPFEFENGPTVGLTPHKQGEGPDVYVVITKCEGEGEWVHRVPYPEYPLDMPFASDAVPTMKPKGFSQHVAHVEKYMYGFYYTHGCF